MTTTSRLRESLAKLAAPGESVGGGMRRMRGGTPDALIAAVLCEIDETILARALRFETDDGRALTIEAYNRRLIRLVPPAPAGTSADLARLFDAPMTSATGDASSRCHEFLLRFFKSVQALTVATAAPEKKLDATQLGPLAIHLAEAWNLSGPGLGAPGHAIERFARTLDELANAWIWIDEGGLRSSSGEAEAVARLGEDIAKAGAEASDPTFLAATFSGADGGTARVRVVLGGHRLAAEADPGAVPALLDRWRALGL